MGKTMCERKKDWEGQGKPKFTCKKCGRGAGKKKKLCKPHKL